MFYKEECKKANDELRRLDKVYRGIAEDGNEIIMQLFDLRSQSETQIQDVIVHLRKMNHVPENLMSKVRHSEDCLSSFKNIKDSIETKEINTEDNGNGVAKGIMAGGALAGGAVAAGGPAVAMAIATTFGTTSGGVAISALSGAAAANAALAFLGGGAVAAGGGGMAAGAALLGLAGPFGIGLAGLCVIGGGIFSISKNKKALAKAQEAKKEYQEKIPVLNKKIEKLKCLKSQTEEQLLKIHIAEIKLYDMDFSGLFKEQQMEVAELVEETYKAANLLNERIV